MKRPRITALRIVWLVLLLSVVVLWIRSLRIADQWLYLTEGGTSYTFGTHPHGVGLEISTHGRELVDLWHPHSPPSPSGLSFSSFRWGTLRSVTYYGIGSNDASPGVFTRTDMRHWTPPASGLLGAGMNTGERIVGPPVPPVPIRSLHTVISIPFWLVLLMLFFPWLLSLRAKLSDRAALTRRDLRRRASR